MQGTPRPGWPSPTKSEENPIHAETMADAAAPPVSRTKSEKKMKWNEENLKENEAIQVCMEISYSLVALIPLTL